MMGPQACIPRSLSYYPAASAAAVAAAAATGDTALRNRVADMHFHFRAHPSLLWQTGIEKGDVEMQRAISTVTQPAFGRERRLARRPSLACRCSPKSIIANRSPPIPPRHSRCLFGLPGLGPAGIHHPSDAQCDLAMIAHALVSVLQVRWFSLNEACVEPSQHQFTVKGGVGSE
jgi:hypothetical protein